MRRDQSRRTHTHRAASHHSIRNIEEAGLLLERGRSQLEGMLSG